MRGQRTKKKRRDEERESQKGESAKREARAPHSINGRARLRKGETRAAIITLESGEGGYAKDSRPSRTQMS